MYITKVLTDVNEDDVRYSTSTSTSTSNGRKQNGDFESGSTNLKSVYGIGNNAINAIDLECEKHSLTNNSSGENVLSVDKRITVKREREETVIIENSIESENREGNENFNQNGKTKERDTNNESEKKKKKDGDKENKSKNESKNEIKSEGDRGSKRGSEIESEKKGVEVKKKAAYESTATVRFSLGLTHTIQPVSMPTD